MVSVGLGAVLEGTLAAIVKNDSKAGDDFFSFFFWSSLQVWLAFL